MLKAVASFSDPWLKKQTLGVKKKMAKEATKAKVDLSAQIFQSAKLPVTMAVLAAIWPHVPYSSVKEQNTADLMIICSRAIFRLGELAVTEHNKGWVPRACNAIVEDNFVRGIFLERSKTDTFSTGTPNRWRISKFKKWCASRALDRVLRRSHTPRIQKDKPLFCDENGLPILARDVIKTLKASITAAGLNAGNFMGHSFRKGGATDLALAGVDIEEIKILGRWTSNSWKKYVAMTMQQLHAFRTKNNVNEW